MTSRPSLVVRELVRAPTKGKGDSLSFEPGVNVLVGKPNTGKSKWLRMLDYLLGNDDKPEDAFGGDLAEKYEVVRGVFDLGGREVVVERRWKQSGLRSKVVVDGEPLPLKEYCSRLLSSLGIPLLHYPQGDPYGSRTWPELGWRSLMRHMYRRQMFWADFADKQPESEQLACLLQFLGLAEHLYSEQYGELVRNQKLVAKLKSDKDQYMSMLHRVSRDILAESDLQVAVTPESLDAAERHLKEEVTRLERQRDDAYQSLAVEVENSEHALAAGASDVPFKELSQQLAELRAERDKVSERARLSTQRLAEVEEYGNSVQKELSRMQRARAAGSVLSDLKVTHCPACDRPLPQVQPTGGECVLCKRQSTDTPETTRGSQRLKFEIEQLEAESREADELMSELTEDLASSRAQMQALDGRTQRIEARLRPLRHAASAILPEAVAIANIGVGELQERMRQLQRVRSALAKREELSQQVADTQAKIEDLAQSVRIHSDQVDFEDAGDAVADGMNAYLNAINKVKPGAWSQREVELRIREKGFRAKVGGGKWGAKLGGTLSLYFLLGYHYSLMALRRQEGRHFPGFLMLDMPAELEDGSSIADKENFVLEPFVEALAQPEIGDGQLIAAGSSFSGLAGANRIELKHVWK